MNKLNACSLLFACLVHSQFSSANEQNNYELFESTTQQIITAIPMLYSLYEQNNTTIFTPPKILDLPNERHVRTLFAESHQLPFVDIQLTFNAGSARDQSFERDLSGLANLTAQSFSEGTTSQTAEQITQEFERLGAQFSAQTFRDMFVIRLRVLSNPQYLSPALDQLIKILTESSLSQKNQTRIINNAQVGQKQLNDDPSRIINIQFYRTLYKNHPYAEPTTGKLSSLKNISEEDINQFKKRYLVTNNLNIAITGDLKEKQAIQIANNISHRLPLGEKASPLPDAQPLANQSILRIPFNSNQSHVMIGHISTTRDNPDYYALEIANAMLGNNGFNSLLMKELREKRGLTYSVNSQMSTMQSQGTFSIRYATQKDQLLESIEATYDTLWKFLNEPLDESLVESTKIGLIKALPNNTLSNATLNAQLGILGFYNLPSDYFEHYAINIQAITATQVQETMKKYINPERLLTVVAGQNIDIKDIQEIYKKKLITSQ